MSFYSISKVRPEYADVHCNNQIGGTITVVCLANKGENKYLNLPSLHMSSSTLSDIF